MFTWTNLLVVVVELEGGENEALDLVPLVTNAVLEEHYLIVGVVVVVDPGVVPINSRGEKQRMHLQDGFLQDRIGGPPRERCSEQRNSLRINRSPLQQRLQQSNLELASRLGLPLSKPWLEDTATNAIATRYLTTPPRLSCHTDSVSIVFVETSWLG